MEFLRPHFILLNRWIFGHNFHLIVSQNNWVVIFHERRTYGTMPALSFVTSFTRPGITDPVTHIGPYFRLQSASGWSIYMLTFDLLQLHCTITMHLLLSDIFSLKLNEITA